jgi:nanoRNase/pAp phosphatase (c-di-AMP/oligoRNAs hydrolase)
MLDKLKKLAGKKRIKIVGHKNPDFDSVASGILLEHFLRSNDVDSRFVCEGLSDSHAIAALEYAGVDICSYCGSVDSDDVLFLVDHLSCLALKLHRVHQEWQSDHQIVWKHS